MCIGRYEEGNIGCCSGPGGRRMARLKALHRARWEREMRWEGWRRCILYLPSCNQDIVLSLLFFLQLVKKYERGDLPKSDWLDKMAFRKMTEIHAVRLTISVVSRNKTNATRLPRLRLKSLTTSSSTSTCPASISPSYSANL